MKYFIRYLLILFLATAFPGCVSDYNSKPVCRVEDGRIIFKLDRRWSEEKKKEIIGEFDLDSNLVAKAYSGKGEILIDSILWKFKTINPFFVELSKPLGNNSGDFIQQNEVLIINDEWIRRPLFTATAPDIPGINNLRNKKVFQYKKGMAQFWLPGNKDASTVYLSGTFNDWSTMQTPMAACDSGWIANIGLQPGKYLYKYIVDGKWVSDPNNELRENNDQQRNNSVVFCYNHSFFLRGWKDARNVVVTGNFTNWNREGYRMEKIDDGWFLGIYLKEGTYTYKFIADGHWLEDPENSDNRADANGNINSFFGIGEQYLFTLRGYRYAQKVIIAGSFNNWRDDELVMQRRDSSGWQLPVSLAPGNYEYKFIVDGKWITDPANPFKNGTGDYTNSVMTFMSNYEFVLENYQNAANVDVAGSFNGWKSDNCRMLKKEGKWIFPLYLKPGKYTYKFIVDGKWILDPGNELYEDNEYGTNNSVLWIDK